MGKKRSAAPPAQPQNLMDAVRPSEADGPLESVVMATYGLALDQPNFFEHDFLPTLLGLGGVRDRGDVPPAHFERKLSEAYFGLICDAHALAEGMRPSLRIDVVPVARPRHHAKVVLLHRRNAVRLIVASANLTHSGYRSQREAAAILDFRADGGLPPAVLQAAVRNWLDALGTAATEPIRTATQRAADAANTWPTRATKTPTPDVQVVFGGGATIPLWRRLVDAWPAGEPVDSWMICSPFWPAPEARRTPFEVIAAALQERGAALDETVMEVICAADAPGDRAKPVFPFAVLQGIRKRGFPATQGRIVAARLETLAGEIPDGTSEGQRALHAKWVVLRGPRTFVVLLGSANFTLSGLGISPSANIEAGVLIVGDAADFREADWKPPLVDVGAADWATAAGGDFAEPPAEQDEPVVWPGHLQRVDLNIQWEQGQDPAGELLVSFASDSFPATTIQTPADDGHRVSSLLGPLDSVPRNATPAAGAVVVAIDADVVRSLLVRRAVRVEWGEPTQVALFPINVSEAAKSGLPSVLGAETDEQQLLAYFHGRLTEEDVLEAIERRAAEPATANVTHEATPTQDLQSYLIRAFVESLAGMRATLLSATYSPRALEAALLGEFSPAAIAQRVLQAFRRRRRSTTAAAFQFVELLGVVAELNDAEAGQDPDAEPVLDVVRRTIDRLLTIMGEAAQRPEFAKTLREPPFPAYLRAVLPAELVSKVLTLAAAPTGSSTSPALVEDACDVAGS